MAIQDEIPRSRLTLTYKTEIEGEKETVNLPLRMLVMGDFSLGESADRKMDFEERRLRKLDGTNLNDVMKDMGMKLKVSVEDVIDGGPDLDIELPITRMASFSPDEIVNHVPKLKGLVALKQLLEQIQSDISNVKKFRALLAQAYKSKENVQELRTQLANMNFGVLKVASDAEAAAG